MPSEVPELHRDEVGQGSGEGGTEWYRRDRGGRRNT